MLRPEREGGVFCKAAGRVSHPQIRGNPGEGVVSEHLPTLENEMRIRRKLDRPDGPGDLNLIPIMNLIVCLVPIVLLGMSVVKVGVIETQAPRFVNPCQGGCDETPPLHLALHVTADSIELRKGARTDELERFARDDLAGLYRRLIALKAAHPEETVANLSADDRIAYREVIAVMDVMRNELDGEVKSTADLARLMPRYAEGRAVLLFPDVMFAMAR